MAGPIANTARVTKRWKLLNNTDEYQGHTSAIEYNDNTSTSSWKGGDDNTIADIVPGEPSIQLTMAMDTENEDSLWRVLFDADPGTKMTFVWYPHYDGTFAVQVEITTLRPPLKTDRAGGVPEVQVTLPCTEATPYTGA